MTTVVEKVVKTLERKYFARVTTYQENGKDLVNLIIGIQDETVGNSFYVDVATYTESVGFIREIYSNSYIEFVKDCVNNYEKYVALPMERLDEWDGDCSE